jgi:hypothetical protein
MDPDRAVDLSRNLANDGNFQQSLRLDNAKLAIKQPNTIKNTQATIELFLAPQAHELCSHSSQASIAPSLTDTVQNREE